MKILLKYFKLNYKNIIKEIFNKYGFLLILMLENCIHLISNAYFMFKTYLNLELLINKNKNLIYTQNISKLKCRSN